MPKEIHGGTGSMPLLEIFFTIRSETLLCLSFVEKWVKTLLEGGVKTLF
jgi:hypothetical protein